MFKLPITLSWTKLAEPQGDELAAWVFWQMAPGFGSRRFLYAIQEIGSALGTAKLAGSGRPRPPWVPRSAWEWAQNAGDPVKVGIEEIERASKLGARIVPVPSPYYPKLLRHIDDAPPVLYIAGRKPPDDPMWISIVGSRKASEYGVRVATKFSTDLVGYGASIVSGLARGIDSAAHRGAVEAHGYTAGVLGAGIGAPMTERLRRLVREVVASGCVMSPFRIGYPASTGTFPARNRIISGMSAACIVVEAADVSGALITASMAMNQGRHVYVVPGDITRPTSRGLVGLMQDGVMPIFGVEQVIDDLRCNGYPIPFARTTQPGALQFSREDAAVYDAVDSGTTFEEIHAKVKMHAKDVMTSLSRLELAGVILRLDGLRFSRRSG